MSNNEALPKWQPCVVVRDHWRMVSDVFTVNGHTQSGTITLFARQSCDVDPPQTVNLELTPEHVESLIVMLEQELRRVKDRTP